VQPVPEAHPAGSAVAEPARTELVNQQVLLRLDQVLRTCKTRAELLSAAVNEPRSLLPYDQAIVWLMGAAGRPEIKSVSGLDALDGSTPYGRWLIKVFSHLSADRDSAPKIITPSALTGSLADEGIEWQNAHALHVPLRGPDGKLRGGWWITRATGFGAQELALAQWVGESVGYSLWSWDRDRLNWRGALGRMSRSKVVRWTLAVLLLSLLIPIQLSALGPAEVTALDSLPVTAFTDGVVKEVLVQPNQMVEAGTPLVQLDDTTIRNRISVAQKAREAAYAELQRATALAFSDDAAKSDLQVLSARVREHDAEIGYLSELLQRLQIVASRKGIAIFSDAKEWRGKPVQTGERIMMLADPDKVVLSIYLSPEDAVQLDVGGKVQMYLNVAPLSSYAAHITQSSYEVTPGPEGGVAYALRAALDDPNNLPRIGLRGTAKVYASPVPLIYYMMRKPLRFMRRMLGL
jgi:multidrug resistance efflux pump